MSEFLEPQCTDEEYCKLVDECVTNKSDATIANGKPEHARYLIKSLFDQASNQIKLYTGNLAIEANNGNGSIPVYGWDILIQSVIDFLSDKKGKLSIVVQKNLDSGKEHPLIKEIKSANLENQVDIRTVSDNSDYNGLNSHFLVADNSAYRLEIDEEKIRAIANFNDSKMSSRLNGVFDVLYKNATIIPIK